MSIYRAGLKLTKKDVETLNNFFNDKSEGMKEFSKRLKVNDRNISVKFESKKKSEYIKVSLRLRKDGEIDSWNYTYLSRIFDLFNIIHLVDSIDDEYLISLSGDYFKKDKIYYYKLKETINTMNRNFSFGFVNYHSFANKADLIACMFLILVRNIVDYEVNRAIHQGLIKVKDKLEYFGYDKTYMDNINVNYYIDDFFRDENYKKDIFMFRVLYDTHGLFEYFLARTYLSIKTNDNERVGKNVLKNAYSMYYEILEDDKYFDKLKKRD